MHAGGSEGLSLASAPWIGLEVSVETNNATHTDNGHTHTHNLTEEGTNPWLIFGVRVAHFLLTHVMSPIGWIVRMKYD